jgi:hypothetical protein
MAGCDGAKSSAPMEEEVIRRNFFVDWLDDSWPKKRNRGCSSHVIDPSVVASFTYIVYACPVHPPLPACLDQDCPVLISFWINLKTNFLLEFLLGLNLLVHRSMNFRFCRAMLDSILIYNYTSKRFFVTSESPVLYARLL